MAQVFSADPEVSRKFKFNLVGGNPRMYKFNAYSATRQDRFYPVVVNVVDKIFGSEYLPSLTESGSVMTDTSAMTEKQRLGWFAINLVVVHLRRADNKQKTDSSLFRENYVEEEDYTKYIEQYSSRFLGLVAGALKQNYRDDVIDQLTSLFGRSGVGNMFEQEANWKLLNSTGNHYCLRVSDRRIVSLPFGGRHVAMFHNVADIRNIPASDQVYAVPNICNFPILDAILPPRYGLQMTIAKDHEVSNAKLADILSGMGLTANTDLHIVFVVPDILDFTTPTNLPGVHLYITTPKCSTEAVLKDCLSKKRGEQGYGGEPSTKK